MAELFEKKVLDILKKQDKRIVNLEKKLEVVQEEEEAEEAEEKRKPSKHMEISFTSFITVAGIVGLIIGLVSFFTYAIAQNWIGPLGQVSIGAFVGLVLLAAGYNLNKSHPNWSIATIAGAMFIEYLSAGFGAWYYQNIPPSAAFIWLLVLTAASLVIAVKYNSLLVAYFSIVGGFLVPIIAHVSSYPVFTFLFLAVLALSVLILSFYKDWALARFLTYLFVIGYGVAYYNRFGSSHPIGELSPALSLVFLGLFFLIYNLSTIIYSIKSDEKINAIDIVTLNLNSFVSAIILYTIVNPVLSDRVIGGIITLVSLVFLAEVLYIKSASDKSNIKPTLYSVFSAGLILLNIGLILILSKGELIRFILLILPQWALYSYLSSSSKDKGFYRAFSYVFFALIAFWWVNNFNLLDETLARGTFVIFMMLVFLVFSFVYSSKEINEKFNGISLILFGFAFWYSLLTYINSLIPSMSDNLRTTILSGIWLAYSLWLFIKTRDNKELEAAKNISLGLLILTLAKIALLDLWRLPSGPVRIIGFVVFGVLLLAGGLMLKNK